MRRKSKTVIFLYAFNRGEWSNEKCKHAKIEMRQNEVTQKKMWRDSQQSRHL